MARGAFAAAASKAFDFQPFMYMDEYLEELAARDMTPSYVRMSRVGLHHFAEFLRTENLLHVEEITRQHIIRFQAHCNGRVKAGDWTKSTSIQTLKKGRAWINWLHSTRKIKDNPWVDIRVGSVPKRPRPVSDENMELLWRAHYRGIHSTDPFTFHRREFILTFLYGWGLRIHELAGLNMANLDVSLSQVVAPNKGGGTKKLPYSDELKKVFQRWSSVRAQHAKTGVDSVLITIHGEPFSTGMIYRTVVDLGKQAGIQINPHRLRDTLGTNLLDDDVPLEVVAEILGHSDIATAKSYSLVTMKQMTNTMARATDPRLRMFQNTRDLRA